LFLDTFCKAKKLQKKFGGLKKKLYFCSRFKHDSYRGKASRNKGCSGPDSYQEQSNDKGILE